MGHLLSGFVPHGSACVHLWSDVCCAVYVISVVQILADIAESIKAGQFDLLIITAASKSQGKIRKDAFEMRSYEKSTRENMLRIIMKTPVYCMRK